MKYKQVNDDKFFKKEQQPEISYVLFSQFYILLNNGRLCWKLTTQFKDKLYQRLIVNVCKKIIENEI